MKSIEDLDVFKLAHQLALKTYSMTKMFPREETFSQVSKRV
jgi:23S rRNA-intervening sequence protein